MLNPPYGNTTNALPASSCPAPNRNGCAINFADPWGNTPGGDPLKAINYPRQGEAVTLPPANVAFPLQAEYVSMPVNVQPMQVTQWNLAYERQLPRRLHGRRDLHGQPHQQHLAGLPGEPGDLHPGQLSAGQYGLTAPGPCSNTSAANLQARALLTLLNPAEGRVLRRQRRRADLRPGRRAVITACASVCRSA